jgi:hypothetical protein
METFEKVGPLSGAILILGAVGILALVLILVQAA